MYIPCIPGTSQVLPRIIPGHTHLLPLFRYPGDPKYFMYFPGIIPGYTYFSPSPLPCPSIEGFPRISDTSWDYPGIVLISPPSTILGFTSISGIPRIALISPFQVSRDSLVSQVLPGIILGGTHLLLFEAYTYSPGILE